MSPMAAPGIAKSWSTVAKVVTSPGVMLADLRVLLMGPD
jgi:hypothetical protein